MKSLLTHPGLGHLEQSVRAAAEDLDGFARAEGLPELELVDAPRDDGRWAEAGCAWAFRRFDYSRRPRALLVARLMKGRRAPEWDIREEGNLVVIVRRNFAWRATALGS